MLVLPTRALLRRSRAAAPGCWTAARVSARRLSTSRYDAPISGLDDGSESTLGQDGHYTGGWSWLKIDGDWQHEAFASWYAALGSGNTSRKRVWHEVHAYPCAACCKAADGGPELEMDVHARRLMNRDV